MSATANASIMGEDVAKMYELYGKLTAAVAANPPTISGESSTFQAILNGVKGSDAVKQLAADYIPQFLHHFPALTEAGINAQMDLIEDEKSVIRIHAIRGLELITKHNPSTIVRNADILTQLLTSVESLELNIVKTAFAGLFAIDAKSSLLSLFSAAATQADAAVRKTILEFLQAQLKSSHAALKKDEAASAALCAGLKTILSTPGSSLERDDLRLFVQTCIAFSSHGNNPAKIKADEALKGELSSIAIVQAGLKDGALNLANDVAVRRFLSVQGVIGNLIAQYGVDPTLFVHVYLAQLLPNADKIAGADEALKAQILQSIVNNSSKLSAKQAQQYFGIVFGFLKQHLPTGTIVAKPAAAPQAAASSSTPAETAAAASASSSAPVVPVTLASEVALALFHLIAPLAPEQLKQATGIFTPTGQPGENLDAPSEKRDEFINRIQFAMQSAEAYKNSLHKQVKALNEQTQVHVKKIQRIKAGKAAALTPASTGQPQAPERPAALAVAEPTIEEEKEALKALGTQKHAFDARIRQSANLQSLAKPLLTKPLPTFLTSQTMHLSWRKHNAGPEGKTNTAGGKGKPQQGASSSSSSSSSNGGGKKQGNKRKSSEPTQQTKQQQNGGGKKRTADGASASSSSNGQNSQKKKHKPNSQAQQTTSAKKQHNTGKKQKQGSHKGGNKGNSNSNKRR